MDGFRHCTLQDFASLSVRQLHVVGTGLYGLQQLVHSATVHLFSAVVVHVSCVVCVCVRACVRACMRACVCVCVLCPSKCSAEECAVEDLAPHLCTTKDVSRLSVGVAVRLI